MEHPAAKEILERITPMKQFSQLSPETLTSLANCGVQAKYKPNQFLWNIGDSGDCCIFIMSGLIEITRPSGTEEETTMGIFGEHDTIGLSAILQRSSYPGNAKALDHSTAIKFYLKPLLSEKESKKISAEISQWLREMMLIHEQILREKIDILSAGTIDDRFLELIKHLVRRFGKIKNGCKYEIKIKLSKSKAAKLMGIRNETAIRLINDWQKRSLINWGEGSITVHDLDLVERYIIQKHSK